MPGMPGNMAGMMKQVQKMQKEMEASQKELDESTFVGKASDGLVEVTFTGKHVVTDIKVDPKVIDPEDPDMLQDLLIMAINDGEEQIAKVTEQKLGKYAKGL
ncbi:YbaB/EbfC family nucleoid-associated protein [Companilactobacillus sp. RD055328]|uniref:YbaB/EbfC family nucleoid-associated protein n=1 Tax=Companilactobacillus sp. RD055328 TaxID=2916634 RepID=UPI001FC7BD8A|nr:YbaB/EbfC family nucleoid-associated protein [Companilactobacillus sp. RD055328]